MLLKIQRKIEIGNHIAVGDFNGVIFQTDYFTFDIKTGDGSIDTIPYNKIREKVITKNVANSELEKQVLLFRIASDLDVNKVIPQIKATLINAPWVAASQEPIVNYVAKENGHAIEAVVYLLRNGHAEKVKEYVLKNISALS
jgi:small-conductance mechanosensitive channel